jgi:CRP-like cAMP-binding protein
MLATNSTLTKSPVIANRLLAGVLRADRNAVLEHCDEVRIEVGDVLCEPGKPYPNVYFPLTGFISSLTSVRGHPPLAAGLIGFEGMVGATLVLDVPVSPLRAVVQGAGTSLRIATAQFQREIRDRRSLRRTLNNYLCVVMAELAQTNACTKFHGVNSRLARLFLMVHDRAQADCFYLTHQNLADMLGVQRCAVTLAAGELQRRNLIHYNRGVINILERKALEAVSCECYAAVSVDYSMLLG